MEVCSSSVSILGGSTSLVLFDVNDDTIFNLDERNTLFFTLSRIKNNSIMKSKRYYLLFDDCCMRRRQSQKNMNERVEDALVHLFTR